VVKKILDQHQGLILVTGAAGQGKSTTLAAMVDFINENRAHHVLTVEDPNEFVHPIKKGVVNQREIEMLGKMLGTADLLGQMADRTYLEKLPFLYREFKEENVPGFESELGLLKKSVGFRDMTLERFEHELGGVNRYMRDHFRVRWGIDEDLYVISMENKIKYLKYAVENHEDDYRKHLSCGSLIEKSDQIGK